MHHRSLGLVLLAGTAIAGACGEPSAPDAPARLAIWSGQERYFGMLLGLRIRVPVTLSSAQGDTLPLPSGFSLVSRNPAVVAVDSATVLQARGTGNTWVVAALDAPASGKRVAADSIEIGVSCTAELSIELTPRERTLGVGESFTPAIRLSTCSGQVQLTDTLRWAAADTTVVRVEAESGRTTGLRPGTTQVAPHGTRYGKLPGVTVTVVPRTP